MKINRAIRTEVEKYDFLKCFGFYKGVILKSLKNWCCITVLRIMFLFRSAGKEGHVCQNPGQRFWDISGALSEAWLVNVFPSPQAMLRTNRGTVGGFFLAGRDVTWWPVSESKLPGDTFPVCLFKDKPRKHVEC